MGKKKSAKKKDEKLSKKVKVVAKSEKKSEKKKPKLKETKKPAEASVHLDEIKRLNRVCGQIEGVSKMLDNGRKLQDVLTQFKAVHSALSSVEQRIFEVYVNSSIEDIVAADKRKERDAKLAELKILYKACA